jgi:photosystem II oxygen-evolving enhancer protein 1
VLSLQLISSPNQPVLVQSAQAISFDEIQGLTYMQVKGTGRANTCPTLDEGTSEPSALKQGTYKLEQFCMEPTKFTVKEESQFRGGATEFVNTKLVTRLTYTLDQVSRLHMLR